MTDATPPVAPPPTPGERRLAHPPSDRYRAAETKRAAAIENPDPGASVARGIAIAAVVAILGAALIVVLGGVLTLTAGLAIVAAATGWGIAASLRFGAGEHLRPASRAGTAVAFAVGAVALGQLGLWGYARIEGGVLSPLEYLAEVFGLLVPIQFAAGAIVAWVAAR